MDWFNKLTKWVDHNRGTFVAFIIIIAIFVMVGVVGCASKAIGLNSGEKVTRGQLERQVVDIEAGFVVREIELAAMVDKLNADKLAAAKKIDAAIVELDRQDKFKADVIEFGGTSFAQFAAGTLNPTSLILPAIGLCGLVYGGGKRHDNIRKDKVISKKSDKTV